MPCTTHAANNCAVFRRATSPTRPRFQSYPKTLDALSNQARTAARPPVNRVRLTILPSAHSSFARRARSSAGIANTITRRSRCRIARGLMSAQSRQHKNRHERRANLHPTKSPGRANGRGFQKKCQNMSTNTKTTNTVNRVLDIAEVTL